MNWSTSDSALGGGDGPLSQSMPEPIAESDANLHIGLTVRKTVVVALGSMQSRATWVRPISTTLLLTRHRWHRWSSFYRSCRRSY